MAGALHDGETAEAWLLLSESRPTDSIRIQIESPSTATVWLRRDATNCDEQASRFAGRMPGSIDSLLLAAHSPGDTLLRVCVIPHSDGTLQIAASVTVFLHGIQSTDREPRSVTLSPTVMVGDRGWINGVTRWARIPGLGVLGGALIALSSVFLKHRLDVKTNTDNQKTDRMTTVAGLYQAFVTQVYVELADNARQLKQWRDSPASGSLPPKLGNTGNQLLAGNQDLIDLLCEAYGSPTVDFINGLYRLVNDYRDAVTHFSIAISEQRPGPQIATIKGQIETCADDIINTFARWPDRKLSVAQTYH
jgi:hypothetical protein